MIKVIAPIMEAQLIETAILNIINHQSLIATKTSRVCYACLLYTSYFVASKLSILAYSTKNA